MTKGLQDLEIIGANGSVYDTVFCWTTLAVARNKKLGHYLLLSLEPTGRQWSQAAIDEFVTEHRLTLFTHPVRATEDPLVFGVQRKLLDELGIEPKSLSLEQLLLDHPSIWVGVNNRLVVNGQVNEWAHALYERGLEALRDFIQQHPRPQTGERAERLLTMAQNAAMDNDLHYMIEVAQSLTYRLQQRTEAVDRYFKLFISREVKGLTRKTFDETMDQLEHDLSR